MEIFNPPEPSLPPWHFDIKYREVQ